MYVLKELMKIVYEASKESDQLRYVLSRKKTHEIVEDNLQETKKTSKATSTMSTLLHSPHWSNRFHHSPK